MCMVITKIDVIPQEEYILLYGFGVAIQADYRRHANFLDLFQLLC